MPIRKNVRFTPGRRNRHRRSSRGSAQPAEKFQRNVISQNKGVCDVKSAMIRIIKIASTGKIPKNIQEERPANTAMVPEATLHSVFFRRGKATICEGSYARENPATTDDARHGDSAEEMGDDDTEETDQLAPPSPVDPTRYHRYGLPKGSGHINPDSSHAGAIDQPKGHHTTTSRETTDQPARCAFPMDYPASFGASGYTNPGRGGSGTSSQSTGYQTTSQANSGNIAMPSRSTTGHFEHQPFDMSRFGPITGPSSLHEPHLPPVSSPPAQAIGSRNPGSSRGKRRADPEDEPLEASMMRPFSQSRNTRTDASQPRDTYGQPRTTGRVSREEVLMMDPNWEPSRPLTPPRPSAYEQQPATSTASRGGSGSSSSAKQGRRNTNFRHTDYDMTDDYEYNPEVRRFEISSDHPSGVLRDLHHNELNKKQNPGKSSRKTSGTEPGKASRSKTTSDLSSTSKASVERSQDNREPKPITRKSTIPDVVTKQKNAGTRDHKATRSNTLPVSLQGLTLTNHTEGKGKAAHANKDAEEEHQRQLELARKEAERKAREEHTRKVKEAANKKAREEAEHARKEAERKEAERKAEAARKAASAATHSHSTSHTTAAPSSGKKPVASSSSSKTTSSTTICTTGSSSARPTGSSAPKKKKDGTLPKKKH
jgi:hypothetical protein